MFGGSEILPSGNLPEPPNAEVSPTVLSPLQQPTVLEYEEIGGLFPDNGSSRSRFSPIQIHPGRIGSTNKFTRMPTTHWISDDGHKFAHVGMVRHKSTSHDFYVGWACLYDRVYRSIIQKQGPLLFHLFLHVCGFSICSPQPCHKNMSNLGEGP